MDVNQAVAARHDAAATFYRLSAATTDVKQKRTYKYLYLIDKSQYFYDNIQRELQSYNKSIYNHIQCSTALI